MYEYLILFIAEYYCIIWICQILFINSLIDGHVGCFRFEATVISATMNICVQVLLCGHMFSFLLSIYLGMELLDPVKTVYLTFGGTASLF